MKTFVKLLSIVSVMALTLSCNLATGLVAPAGSSQPAQSPATQPPSSEGQATAAPSEDGKPAPTAQANQSAFTGGITARAGYDLALPKAQAWSSSAVLESVQTTAANVEGKSKSWSYLFADDTLTAAADRSQGYVVTVGEKGVTEARPGDINVGDHLLQSNIADWLIDSDKAVAICEQAGGSRFRASNPAAYVNPWLQAVDYQTSTKIPQFTSKNIFWNIQYQAPGNSEGGMLCEVDANTGKLVVLNSPLDQDPAAKPITAQTGFKTALAKAQEWNPAASLLSVHVKYAKPDPSGLNGGVANSWEYKFIALPEPKGVDYQPEYDVVVASTGPVDYRVGPENTGHAVIGSQADWLIDSDAVFSLAEANGGKDFRGRHPNAKYAMWLDLAFSQVDTLTTSHNVRWTASYYLENDQATHLVVEVDGTTGLLAPRP